MRPRSTPITRREILCQGGASAVLGMLPARAQAAVDYDPLRDLHKIVAGHVLSLTSGEPMRLNLLLPTGARANVAPIAEIFQQMTDVKIQIIDMRYDDISTELALGALSGKQPYDLALPPTPGLSSLVAAQIIKPLSDFAARYEPDHFRDGLLFGTGNAFDDEIYGFQTDGDTFLMFFNKSMLRDKSAQARYSERYGTPLDVPQTWDELDRQMAFFHQPEIGQWGGLLFRNQQYLAWEWWLRLHSKGIWPLSPDMEPNIASEPGIEALEELISATQFLAPDIQTIGLFENWKRFAEGKTYCNVGWGGSQKNFQTTAMRQNMIYSAMPGGLIRGDLHRFPYFNWGWSYVVPQRSTAPEIAYLFALFASSPNMSTLAVRQKDGFFDPFRDEHYADDSIQETYSEDFLAVHKASLKGAIPDLYITYQSEYLSVLNKWLARALRGSVTPRHALERAAQRWRLITKRAGPAHQISRWQDLRAQYPLPLRNALRDID